MSTSAINNLSSNYLQSIVNSAINSAGSTTNSSLSKVGTSSVAKGSDSSRLSPTAQLLSTLQQLQQSNPTQYQQVTQQIATNLQTAAQTAQSDGNPTEASQLNQLSTDFKNASTSGQLPNSQDLAQAMGGGQGVGGHHHHHHHSQAASAASGSDSSTSSSTGSASTASGPSNTDPWSQILAAYQTSAAQNSSLDPSAIIFSTLSSAGVSMS
jgi:hypothetical protein